MVTLNVARINTGLIKKNAVEFFVNNCFIVITETQPIYYEANSVSTVVKAAWRPFKVYAISIKDIFFKIKSTLS